MFWIETIETLFTIMPTNTSTSKNACNNIKHAFFECVKYSKNKPKNRYNYYVIGVTPSDR